MMIANPAATREILNSLRVPDADKDGRMPVHLEALAGIKSAYGDSLLLSGRVAAPFSSVALLYGIREGLILELIGRFVLLVSHRYCLQWRHYRRKKLRDQ